MHIASTYAHTSDSKLPDIPPKLQDRTLRASGTPGLVNAPPDLSPPALADNAPPGRPQLIPPPSADDNSIENLLLDFMTVKRAATDSELRTAVEAIKSAQEKTETASSERIDKMMDQIAEQEKRKASAFGKFFLNVIGKVIGIVAAVAVAVVSAGTMSALAVAAIVYLATDLTLDVASQASGKDVRLGTLVASGIEQLALAAGHSAEKAKEIAQWSAMAVVLVLSIAASVATGAGAAAAAAAGKTILATLSRGAAIASGLTEIGAGGISIAEGKSQKRSADMEAAKLELQAFMEKMQLLVAQEQDQIRQLLERLQSASKAVAGMLQGSHAAKQNIIVN